MGHDIDAENSIVEDHQSKKAVKQYVLQEIVAVKIYMSARWFDVAANDMRNSSLELNCSSTSVDTMFELDHLRKENQRLELSEAKLSKQLHDLKILGADSDENLISKQLN